MSTVIRIAQEKCAAIAGHWVRTLLGWGSDSSDLRGMLHPQTQPHAPTASVMGTMRIYPANDNDDWEGGFCGHLGVYRRD